MKGSITKSYASREGLGHKYSGLRTNCHHTCLVVVMMDGWISRGIVVAPVGSRLNLDGGIAHESRTGVKSLVIHPESPVSDTRVPSLDRNALSGWVLDSLRENNNGKRKEKGKGKREKK